MANKKDEIVQLSDGTWIVVQPNQRRFAAKHECEWAVCFQRQLRRINTNAMRPSVDPWGIKLFAILAGIRKRMPAKLKMRSKKTRREQTWEQSLRTSFSKILKQIKRMDSTDEWEKCIDSKRSALQKRARFDHHKQFTSSS